MTDSDHSRDAAVAAAERKGLPPEARPTAALVAEIREGLDLEDRASVAEFGEHAQRAVAEFADGVLRETLNKDAGPIGELLADMLAKVQGLAPDRLKEQGLVEKLFGGTRRKVVRFKEQFGTVAAQVDRIAIALDRQRDGLRRDVAMLDQFYVRNLEHLRQLEAHIEAGERCAADYEATELPKLEAAARQAEGAESHLAAQRLADARQAVERFQRRLHDLKLSRAVAQQSLPQIRLIQGGNETLVDKLQSSISTTIPTWKNQMTIALALHRQESALSLDREVADATNAMLRKNAEMLKTGSLELERQAQRGVVDVETLQETNRKLVETISGVLEIQRGGNARRREAEQQLRRIEADLKQALTAAAEGRPPETPKAETAGGGAPGPASGG
ncbi:MAG: toxic anion resistance protein [Tistlia sp.]|uniref:toxic anion resistance protein n=1 Tax=Tistlia sp. TaxID=3057121 RepID=UPI0034A47867